MMRKATGDCPCSRDGGGDPTSAGRMLTVPTAEDMRALGHRIARVCGGGDVILLSGPLGSGKTTFAQGFGAGMGVRGPVVSPTFTIARELSGRFADGSSARLVHVDAYRLGGDGFAPGQDARDMLLDELEALGLDEELENPSQATVVLMEWGEQMAAALADVRLEVHINRPVDSMEAAEAEPDADGDRRVELVPVGGSWPSRLSRAGLGGRGTDAQA